MCRECNRYQNRIFEYSKFWLTISGLLGATISAITYVYPSIESFVRSYLEPEMEVITFATETKKSIIRNIGKSDVFIEYVRASPVHPKIIPNEIHHIVNKHLRTGESVTLDLESKETKQIHKSTDKPYTLFPMGPRAIQEELAERFRNNEGVRIAIHSEDHPTIESVYRIANGTQVDQRDVDKMMVDLSIPYKCRVYFRHRYSKEKSPFSFPCIGYFEINFDFRELDHFRNSSEDNGRDR